MILTAVQQENKQEQDSVKESNVTIVEEKTKRPREPSEEKQEMGEKPEDDVSPTDAKKFKNRDIRRREQDRTTEIQKESLIAGSTPKHKLDDDIGEVEEKEAKKPKLTSDPARSTKK